MEQITEKVVNEIYNEILKKNKDVNINSVPHSDEFIKQMYSLLGVTEGYVRESIQILIDSNRIFSMEIVSEDLDHGIKRVEGYAVADQEILYNLKLFFQDQLVSIYESENYKRLAAHVIIKEIMPTIRMLNSTEMGKIANKAIMLEQFEKIIIRNIFKYDAEKQKSLQKEILDEKAQAFGEKKEEEATGDSEEMEATESQPTPEEKKDGKALRAIDSEEFKDYSDKKETYPLSRIINIYGIEFFVRVKLRKCEFKTLKSILDHRQIKKHSDLLLMKRMVARVRKNINTDPELRKHQNDIYSLERAIGQAMFYSRN